MFALETSIASRVSFAYQGIAGAHRTTAQTPAVRRRRDVVKAAVNRASAHRSLIQLPAIPITIVTAPLVSSGAALESCQINSKVFASRVLRCDCRRGRSKSVRTNSRGPDHRTKVIG